MKNNDCISVYWRKIKQKAFVVSLREGQRPTKQSIFRIGIILVIVLGFGTSVFAQKDKNPEKQEKTRNVVASTSNEVQGEVTWKNKKYIAIVFNRDLVNGTEEEILLPLDGTIKLINKRSLDDIKIGDTVSIQYDEDTEEDSLGEKKESRKAKEIRFIKSTVAPSAKEGSLDETEIEEFPFKGIKGE